MKIRIEAAAMSVILAPQRERLVSHLHGLGSRALWEFLAELAREHGIAEDIDRRLESYRRLDRATLKAIGGDKFTQHLFAVSIAPDDTP